MLTFNHPSMDIIAELCQEFCAKVLGETASCTFDHRNIYHSLTADAAIPVIPAAVRAYQLPHRSMPTYKCRPKHNEKDVYLPFADFARLSYEAYAAQKSENLLATTPSDLAVRLNLVLGK